MKLSKARQLNWYVRKYVKKSANLDWKYKGTNETDPIQKELAGVRGRTEIKALANTLRNIYNKPFPTNEEQQVKDFVDGNFLALRDNLLNTATQPTQANFTEYKWSELDDIRKLQGLIYWSGWYYTQNTTWGNKSKDAAASEIGALIADPTIINWNTLPNNWDVRDIKTGSSGTKMRNPAKISEMSAIRSFRMGTGNCSELSDVTVTALKLKPELMGIGGHVFKVSFDLDGADHVFVMVAPYQAEVDQAVKDLNNTFVTGINASDAFIKYSKSIVILDPWTWSSFLLFDWFEYLSQVTVMDLQTFIEGNGGAKMYIESQFSSEPYNTQPKLSDLTPDRLKKYRDTFSPLLFDAMEPQD